MKKTLFAIALISFVSCTKQKNKCFIPELKNTSWVVLDSNENYVSFTNNEVVVNSKKTPHPISYNILIKNDTLYVYQQMEMYKFLINTDTLKMNNIRTQKITFLLKN